MIGVPGSVTPDIKLRHIRERIIFRSGVIRTIRRLGDGNDLRLS